MRVRFEGSHVRSRTVETYGYRVEYTVHDRRLQWLALVEGQGRIWVFKGQFYVLDALAGAITHHPIDTVTDRIRHEIDAITRECRHSVMSCNFCGLVRVNDRMPGAPTDRDTDHRSADRVRMRAVIREGQELRRRACSLRLASTGAVDRLLHLQSEIHQDRSRSIRLSEP